jgi:hypothetical protein
MNPIEFALSVMPGAAKLNIGNHQISQHLREMNLSANPIFFQYMPVMEAILYGPRNLMDD